MRGLLHHKEIFHRIDRSLPAPGWLFDRENLVFLACKENNPDYIPVPFVYMADLIKVFLQEHPEYDTCPALHQMTDEARFYHDFKEESYNRGFGSVWRDYYDQKMRDFIVDWREKYRLTDIPLEMQKEPPSKNDHILTGEEVVEALRKERLEAFERAKRYLDMKKDSNILFIRTL